LVGALRAGIDEIEETRFLQPVRVCNLRGWWYGEVFSGKKGFLPRMPTDAAKPAQGLRIDDVKSQLFIGEAVENFHDGTAHHLVGTHAVGTGMPQRCLVFIQILQNVFTDGRLRVNDGADRLQLLALGMIHDVGHQSHLFLPFFAHFVSGSFSAFVVILVGWRFPIYYMQ
jgi:hypothetical protein